MPAMATNKGTSPVSNLKKIQNSLFKNTVDIFKYIFFWRKLILSFLSFLTVVFMYRETAYKIKLHVWFQFRTLLTRKSLN